MNNAETLAGVLLAAARRAGRVARNEGLMRSAPSYPTDTMRDEWAAGWDEADAALKLEENARD